MSKLIGRQDVMGHPVFFYDTGDSLTVDVKENGQWVPRRATKMTMVIHDDYAGKMLRREFYRFQIPSGFKTKTAEDQGLKGRAAGWHDSSTSLARSFIKQYLRNEYGAKI